MHPARWLVAFHPPPASPWDWKDVAPAVVERGHPHLRGDVRVLSYFANFPIHQATMDTTDSAWQDIGLHAAVIQYWNTQPHFRNRASAGLESPATVSLPHGLPVLDSVSDRAAARPGHDGPCAGPEPRHGPVDVFCRMRVWRSPPAAALGVYLSLFGGSFWGLWHFFSDFVASRPSSLLYFALSNSKDYTNIWDHGLYFSNLVTASILPQRSISSATAPSSSCFLSLVELTRRPGEQNRSILYFSAVLTGLMPLAHIHGWLMCEGLLLWNTAVESVRSRRAALGLGPPW